jgi:ubiquinone/menaquinone biosynthesis C-methylase UbiE
MAVAEKPPGMFDGTEMPTSGWWQVLWPHPEKVLGAIGLRPGMVAVDLCAGDGWFTLPMARIARQVTAIDIDRELLAVARRSLAQAHLANCDFVVGDAYDVHRLTQEPADFVLIANAFHGVPDRPHLARAIRLALKPGGRLAVVNWHPRPREETIVAGEPRGPRTELRLSPEETIADVAAGGLKLIRVVEIAPYHYGAIFENPPD